MNGNVSRQSAINLCVYILSWAIYLFLFNEKRGVIGVLSSDWSYVLLKIPQWLAEIIRYGLFIPFVLSMINGVVIKKAKLKQYILLNSLLSILYTFASIAFELLFESRLTGLWKFYLIAIPSFSFVGWIIPLAAIIAKRLYLFGAARRPWQL